MADNRRMISIRVPTELWTGLKEVARANHMTLTDLCEGILEDGVRRRTLTPGITYLMPEVHLLLESQLKAMEERFARLLARTAIETGTSKRLLMNLIVATDNATQEELKEAHELAWEQSHAAIRRPLESIDELVKSMRSEDR
jgi:hypothetical protein